MKYWNKSKDVRQRCWTRVNVIKDDGHYKAWSFFLSTLTQQEYNSLIITKLELQRNPSTSKFFIDFDKGDIWFEKAKEATLFLLKLEKMQ